jgi:hypothetical protein
MKKEFIPYEIALALKELGFDEECFGFYNNAENVPYLKQDLSDELKLIYKGDFDAPTFSQAFRFFREKYKLQCYPILDTEDVYWCLFSDGIGSGYLMENGDYGYESDEHLEFKTYEEAELECLKKLISIVKEQK